MNHKVIVQGTNHKVGGIATVDNRVVNMNSTVKEQRMMEEVKTQPPKGGAENLKPQPLTRSRSSRRSRDLDLNPETLLNPIPSSARPAPSPSWKQLQSSTPLQAPTSLVHSLRIENVSPQMTQTTMATTSVLGEK